MSGVARTLGLVAALLATAGCIRILPAPALDPRVAPCQRLDPVLAHASFVVVVDPAPGARVHSPFHVVGCSRTFESNVQWTLRGRDGRTLGAGHATGGGVDGPRVFGFAVSYRIDQAEVGALEVIEPDPSDGEGHPPVRVLFPLVLAP